MSGQVVEARDQAIDALRGLAVVLMIAAHTTDYISEEKNYLWNMLRDLGNAVCYSSFLFAFGMSAYLALLGKPASKPVIVAALKTHLRAVWSL